MKKILVLILVFVCSVSYGMSAPSSRYLLVWVDKLSLRSMPSLKSKVIKYLKEGELVAYQYKTSKNQITVALRGNKYTTPFYYVLTSDGQKGWTFGGAVKQVLWTDSEKEIFIYEKPKGKKIQKLGKGQRLELLKVELIKMGVNSNGIPDNLNWCKIKYKDEYAWIPMTCVTYNAPVSNDNFNVLSEKIIKMIKDGKDISPLFINTDIKLKYHADNRCDGSTDGETGYKKKNDLKNDITIRVYNNGEGWLEECKGTVKKGFRNIKFSLKDVLKSLKHYNHSVSNFEKEISFDDGAPSEIMIFRFKAGKDFLIYEIEYRNEDPG